MSADPSKKKQALYKLADYLSRRDHSVLELRSKLNRKFSPTDTDWAIEEAESQGWLSAPEEIAQRAIISLQKKRKGLRYIYGYLKERGLPEVPIDLKLEFENATLLLEGKYGEPKQLSFAEQQKAYNYLYRRGYKDATIQQALAGEDCYTDLT